MDNRPIMLIVDDIGINREMLKNVFRDEYCVVEAEGGQEAIDFLRDNNEIAVILLDVFMPDVDGFKVLEFIKSETELCRIPVVMITQYNEREIKEKAMRLGASAFVFKPYNVEEIRERVRFSISNEHEDVFRYYVERDHLTGIYNREYFSKKTVEMFRENPEEEYILLTLNIRRFKVINELFGMTVGDRVLKDLAQKFERDLKNIGTYGRLEADNFAVCVPRYFFSIPELEKRIESGLQEFDLNYDLALYVGIYRIDDEDISVNQMCNRANMALRTIKGNYAKRYAFYDDSIRNNILKEQQIINDMDEALENNQFCVYFQPIYSASSQKPISAEALVRWKHPQKGMVSPGLFVPLLERNGLITKLDYFVWEEVCKFLSEQISEGRPFTPISVNVSRVNLCIPNLREIFVELVKKYNLDPSYLKLEITESAYTDNGNRLVEIIQEFQNEGFQIYMDDFGSGYSSLNMLKDVPVDILKIDREFISQLEESERAGSVLNSIVRMAKWLEMDVVAEGVETKAQLEFLRSIGCDRIQGFYFSKPLSADKFKELLSLESTYSYDEEHSEQDDVKIDYNAFFEMERQEDFMLEGMLGAVGVYELTGDILEVVRVNNQYYEITGSDAHTMFKDTKNATSWVCEEDRELLVSYCKQAEQTKEVTKFSFRRYHQSGNLMKLHAQVRYIGKKGMQSILCIVFNEDQGKTTVLEQNISSVEIETKKDKESNVRKVGGKRNKVLVVDDNQVNRAVLRKILSENYEVLEAENGKTAYDITEKEKDNLVAVLLDIVMPIMSGYDYLEKRREDKELRNIPVIVLSQAEHKDSEEKALEYGADDFLKKPYDQNLIKEKLEIISLIS